MSDARCQKCAEGREIVFEPVQDREFEAEVRGSDTDSDIAILRLRGKAAGLRPAKFANSDKVRVGEFAIAIGAPYELEYSVTFGHISAKGRAGLSTGMMDEDFIQTDANINPGNSGGPLLNLGGEVIGVTSMKLLASEGLGFAIPIAYVKHFLENRDSFAFDKNNPNTGIRYLEAPRRRNFTPPPTPSQAKP